MGLPALIQHIDLFPLLLGETVRAPQRIAGNERTAAGKDSQHQPDTPEAALNVGQ